MKRFPGPQHNNHNEVQKGCVKLWRSRDTPSLSSPRRLTTTTPFCSASTVSSRILIVEHPRSSPHRGGDEAFFAPEWGGARHATWDSFSPEVLRSMKDTLVIANATAGGAKIAEFFQWLRSNRISVPIFAILPADDAALVHSATGTVDDFLIWPIRPEELKSRVARLLGPQHQDLTDTQA